jgi:hypothetical protein
MSYSAGLFETCHHGVGFLCLACRDEEARDRKAKLKAGTHAWMVVQYRGDGKYSAGGALKQYKNRAAAEKYAEALNKTPAHNTVVRFLKKGNL